MTYTKARLREQFERQQCCLIWDVQSMVRLEQHWERAQCIVLKGGVHRSPVLGNGTWVVASQSRPELMFTVRLDGVLGWDKGCSCEDYMKRAPWGWCKHRLAAWIVAHLTEAQLKSIREEKVNARSQV